MLRFVLVFSLVFAAVLGWQITEFIQDEFPNTAVLKNSYPRVIYRGPDEPFDIEIVKSRPQGWTSLGEISMAAKGAVIVSEDWAFFQHKGYDPEQIKEAIRKDLHHGGFARGASTITQQVIKNVFLERDKNLWRKLKEFILATRLEKSVSKHRILEVYFNIAEWGEGIFGIRSAAWHYFGKSPAELTAKEGAFLAMLLPSPKRYSQSFRKHELTPYATKTIQNILQNLVRAHYITAEERLVVKDMPLAFEINRPAVTPPLSGTDEPEPEAQDSQDALIPEEAAPDELKP